MRRTLNERVHALELQVAQLKADLTRGSTPKDWRKAIGLFPKNELMKKIDAAGQAIREADRRAVRKQRNRPRSKV
jgi:hypothetical protein